MGEDYYVFVRLEFSFIFRERDVGVVVFYVFEFRVRLVVIMSILFLVSGIVIW